LSGRKLSHGHETIVQQEIIINTGDNVVDKFFYLPGSNSILDRGL